MSAGSSLVPQCKIICSGRYSPISYGNKVLGHFNVYGSFCTAIGALCICMHMSMVLYFNWFFSCCVLWHFGGAMLFEINFRRYAYKSVQAGTIRFYIYSFWSMFFFGFLGFFHSALAPAIVYWLSLAAMGIVP
jgi:hypothetical protein